MPAPYTIMQQMEFGGVEQRGSKVSRSPAVAEEMQNFDKLRGDEGTNRKGYKAVGDNASAGGLGFWSYAKLESTGAVTVEKLTAGSSLYKVITGTLALTYVGVGTSVSCSMLVDPTDTHWHFKLLVDGTTQQDLDCGVGFDEAAIYTLNDLITAINLDPDFTAALTPSTAITQAVPAAFLPSLHGAPFEAGALNVSFLYNSLINHPTGAPAPFAGLVAQANTAAFRNISSVERDNCRYFVNGYDEMQKYDGSDCYRAGMPIGDIVSAVDATVGLTPEVGAYVYGITNRQYDAAGNVIEGIMELLAHTVAGAGKVNVTVNNILSTTGFNTDCAIVAGAQAAVHTIAVDNGAGGAHTMKIGQTAYFYDAVSAAYVERKITNIAAGSITVDGAAVTVADNAVISNNLRICVWRTSAGGTILRLLAEIPNDSFNATQVYADTTASAGGGEEYTDPALDGVEHSLPPKFRYLTLYKNLPVGGGSLSEPNTCYFAGDNSAEYWPEINEFYTKSPTNAAITGLTTNGSFLYVFKDYEVRAVIGSLEEGTYDVDFVNAMGSASHESIVEIDDIKVWVGKKSFYASKNGSAPFDIGAQLYKFFETGGVDADHLLHWERTIAVADRVNERMLFFVPAETSTGGVVHANGFSVVFALNTAKMEWYAPWTNMNMAAGAVVVDNDLFWVERRYSTFLSSMSYQVYQRLNNGEEYDYVDHTAAIETTYRPGWAHGGQPSIEKEFHALRVYGLGPNPANFDLDVQTEINFQSNVAFNAETIRFGVGGGAGWGLDAYGLSPYGAATSSNIQQLELTPASVWSIRPVFTHKTLYAQMVLAGWEVEMVTPYQQKMTKLVSS